MLPTVDCLLREREVQALTANAGFVALAIAREKESCGVMFPSKILVRGYNGVAQRGQKGFVSRDHCPFNKMPHLSQFTYSPA